ncbi:hypothetical protein LTR66_001803 [Elasticomyces elasticus]|nr:hypothetical protein LTR50_000146 [Elasticomyces elasticus]KAK4999086.1 hypothetical protein LTR66_001803 [Elasticomyces elasticus]
MTDHSGLNGNVANLETEVAQLRAENTALGCELGALKCKTEKMDSVLQNVITHSQLKFKEFNRIIAELTKLSLVALHKAVIANRALAAGSDSVLQSTTPSTSQVASSATDDAPITPASPTKGSSTSQVASSATDDAPITPASPTKGLFTAVPGNKQAEAGTAASSLATTAQSPAALTAPTPTSVTPATSTPTSATATFEITLRFPTGKTVTVEVSKDQTLVAVLFNVKRQTNVLPAACTLMFKGKRLDLKETIEQCEVKAGDTVHLMNATPQPSQVSHSPATPMTASSLPKAPHASQPGRLSAETTLSTPASTSAGPTLYRGGVANDEALREARAFMEGITKASAGRPSRTGPSLNRPNPVRNGRGR